MPDLFPLTAFDHIFGEVVPQLVEDLRARRKALDDDVMSMSKERDEIDQRLRAISEAMQLINGLLPPEPPEEAR